MNWELKALKVAYRAHEDQKRKYTGEPYITHPIAVAGILKGAGITNEYVLAAALLHDVIEDTNHTALDLYHHFPSQVVHLVNEVTDVSKPSDGNRKTRKEIDRKHLQKASPSGQTIKLADLIHNTQSIVQYDKDFARVYLKEKEKLLSILSQGDVTLQEKALEVLQAAKEEIYKQCD